MSRKHYLALTAVILAAGLASAGCSKSTTPEKETKSETPAVTQAETQAETPAQTPEETPAVTEEQTEELAPAGSETEAEPEETEAFTEEAAEEETTTEEETTEAPADPLADLKEGEELTLGSFNGSDLVWVVTYSQDGLSFAEYASSLPLPAGTGEDKKSADAWLNETFLKEAFDEEVQKSIFTARSVEEPADGQIIPELVIWQDTPESLLSLAEGYAENDSRRALEIFELAKTGLPEDAKPYLARIDILKKSGNLAEAMEEANSLNDTLGINEEASLFLIDAYMQEGNIETAAVTAAKAADAGIESAMPAFEQFGADAFDRKDYEYALNIYELAGNQEKVDEINLILNPFLGLEEGDLYSFGSYEQDNNESDGKEEVEWIVMKIDGDKLWLISSIGLDARPFNNTRSSTSWADSSLRTWLNEDFLNTVFSEEEAAWILPTAHPDGTEDMVWLLSVEEAEEFFNAGNTWKLKVSDYAAAHGAKYNTTKRSASWLLRSPGLDEVSVSYVDGLIGEISDNYYVNGKGAAVRPVICVGKETEE